MNIPYLGNANSNKNHGIITVCGNYSNLRLYMTENTKETDRNRAYDIVDSLDDIYRSCQLYIEYRLLNDKYFQVDLLDNGYETLIINHAMQFEEQVKLILLSLNITDVYLDIDDKKLAFHICFHESFDNMLEVVLDFSLKIIQCEVKLRKSFLNFDSYRSSEFVDMNFLLNNDYYEELKASVCWAGEIAGKVPERLNKYISDIDKYRVSRRQVIDENVWVVANAFVELEGLRYVYEHFKSEKNENLKEKMYYIVNGVAYKYPELKVNNDKCRNFLFELKVASDYIRVGSKVSVNQRSDVIIDNKYHIECKKVSTLDKLVKRLSDAVGQIEDKTTNGIIYIDASDVLIKECAYPLINDKRIDLPNKNGECYTDHRVREDFTKLVSSHADRILSSINKKIFNKLSRNILVVNFSIPCIHLSPIHERVMNLTLRCIISNERNHEMKLLVENSL
ncbi:hypothetical protein SE23_09135 [Vibrio sinaloensis]|nr:hypothetical protein SE23_09135 [Vibrio sinaloensis]